MIVEKIREVVFFELYLIKFVGLSQKTEKKNGNLLVTMATHFEKMMKFGKKKSKYVKFGTKSSHFDFFFKKL